MIHCETVLFSYKQKEYRVYLSILHIWSMQWRFCSMFGWTYKLSVVLILECPSSTLTVL